MSSQKPRALLAEDHPILRDLYKACLEALGFRCTQAAHGAAAWQQFQQSRFDLLVTDHHMPEMSGLELIQNIRAYERTHARPRMPIVAMTAGHGKLLQHLKDAGADEVLTKLCVPSHIKQLLIRRGLIPAGNRHCLREGIQLHQITHLKK
ncbi:response regulator [Sulfidibacter corallicola]|uniref:Response regulator n=1 Tax=Sulfidibacter corallicola TaxID=2818388 RepID=A0A8A4TSI2_SULCO|nr:response regulator [Sulfidibacter corallicola]QTD52114.1 response regulator [Sulfidibacter corallicola]